MTHPVPVTSPPSRERRERPRTWLAAAVLVWLVVLVGGIGRLQSRPLFLWQLLQEFAHPGQIFLKGRGILCDLLGDPRPNHRDSMFQNLAQTAQVGGQAR